MKVAFVMPGVGIVGRGAEAFVVELCAALAERHGFEVTLFSRGPASVPHRRIRALPRDTRWINALYSANRWGKKVFDTLFLDPLSLEWYTAALSAFPAIWRDGYDVVVMEGGLVGAWGSRLLRRLRGVPFVDIAHGQDPKWEGAFARQKPDRVVAFTEAARRMILARAPRARVVVIPHGVDLDSFRPDATPVPLDLPGPVVVCAGAVDSHKRMDLAVEACARIGASLVILGEGPEGAAVDRLAADRLPGRYLRRTVPRAEMPGWYAAADCFTLPSRTESFGLTYLEALACGVPCVAPDDEVRREVIGDAGICCDVTDPAAYAGALTEALARDWGSVPRQRAERFPVTATIDAYAALLRDLT
ncbi:MAG TPA: glycosyltransferase [Thermoanaerobaculia bacterium]|nr:glycosyltransferase [Thermoanaerobaculia bacterium]